MRLGDEEWAIRAAAYRAAITEIAEAVIAAKWTEPNINGDMVLTIKVNRDAILPIHGLPD